MVWYFIGVYIINRTLHGCLEIRNFSSRVEEKFRISARPCNILYISTYVSFYKSQTELFILDVGCHLFVKPWYNWLCVLGPDQYLVLTSAHLVRRLWPDVTRDDSQRKVISGFEIATDTVANATNIFSLATKNSSLATRFLYDLDLK